MLETFKFADKLAQHKKFYQILISKIEIISD